MKKKWLVRTLLIVSVIIIFIGPWPISDPPYTETTYFQETMTRLAKQTPTRTNGQFRANFAVVDITPEMPFSLAGYSGRKPKTATGIRTPVQAQALSLAAGDGIITIINAELLLPLPQLVDKVAETTGIPREQLFFSVTHTHSGPGGYQDNWVHEFSLGEYDETYALFLTERISEAVTRSRENLFAAKLAYQRLKPGQTLSTNSLRPGAPTHDSIHTLQILDRQNTLRYLLVGFSAHPTLFGRTNRELDGDYPGRLMRLLAQQLQVPVAFAISAPGAVKARAHSGKVGISGQLENSRDYAAKLAREITNKLDLSTATVSESGSLMAILLNVQLNGFQRQFGDSVRLSPLLMETFVHPPQTYIHALGLGELLLVSFPADYSGGLARELEERLPAKGCTPWPFSFNGDYIGYVSPSQDMDTPHYTTRGVNFFGRWAGDYFNHLSEEICNKFRSSVSIP